MSEYCKGTWNAVMAVILFCLVICPQATAALKITQIMYDMYGDDGGENCAWEWVEIYNNGGSSVSLSGYVFDDGNGTAHGGSNISSGTIAAGGYAYLYNEDEIDKADFIKVWGKCNAVGVTGWAANGLNNTGDKVGIWSSYASYSGDHSSHSSALDSVQYTNASPWPVSNNSGSIYLTNISADNDTGSNWDLAVSGALGDSISGSRILVDSKESTEYAAINGYPRLQIVQIMYDMAGDDGGNNCAWEWVEIYNDWPIAVDVSGYVLDDKNTTSHASANVSSGTIYPSRTAYFYNADEVSSSDFKAAWGNRCNTIGVTGWAANGLNNSGDGVGIWGSYSDYSGDRSTHANVIDSVLYDDASPWPSGIAGGHSIYLTDVDSDNDNGSNWAESIADDRGFDEAGAPGTIVREYEAGGATGDSTASIDMSPKGESPLFRYRCYTGTRPSYVSEHTALGNITHSTSYDVVTTYRGSGFESFDVTDFDGSTEYIQGANPLDTRDLSGNDSFTIMAWFKADSVSGTKTIFSNTEDNNGFSLKIISGKLRGEVRFNDNNGSLSIQDLGTEAEAPTLETGKWYNVVFHVRKLTSTYEMRIYINGTRTSYKEITGIQPNGYIRQSVELPIVGDEPSNGQGAGTSPFNGQIYAVTVHNYDMYLDNYIRIKRVRDGSRYFGGISYHDTMTRCLDHRFHKTATHGIYEDAMENITDRFTCPFANDKYCPQGVAYDSSNGYIYITLYWLDTDGGTGSYPSIMAEIRKSDNELRRVFQLKTTGGSNLTAHVSGAAYYSGNVYICAGSAYLNRYNMSSAGSYTFNADNFANPRFDQNPFNAAATYSMSLQGNPSMSCLSLDTDYNGDKILWTSHCDSSTLRKLLGFKINTSTKAVYTSATHSYTVPVYNVQGVYCYSATSTQLKFYIMTSSSDFPSALYDVTYNRGISTAASYTLLTYLPAGGEDLTMIGSDLWTVSESGAKYYQNRTNSFRWLSLYPFIYGLDVGAL